MTEKTKFINVQQTAAIAEISVTTVWLWVRQDRFPAPFKMNGKTRWVGAEVEAWVAAQIENREVA